MVMEYLFPENWLEKKVRYAFIIAVVYSILGIFTARLLFGANAGLASVIFTSLLILPYLQKMFLREEREEEGEKRISLFDFRSIIRFFKDNQAIRVYFSIFIGVYFTYMFFSFVLPYFGFDIFNIFKEQLFIDPALRGRAAFGNGMFLSILINNWWVLLACFVLSLVSGDGAIFFITWNASSWGALFGYRAFSASMVSGESGLLFLLMIFLITLPHFLLEGGAYILAAISGSIISDEIVKKRKNVVNFLVMLLLVVILLFALKFISSLFESYVFGFLSMILVVLCLRFMSGLFNSKKLKKVFINNYELFVLALILFLIGAIVETFVLGNSDVLSRIYLLSGMFG